MALANYMLSFPCPGCHEEYARVEQGNCFCEMCLKKLSFFNGLTCPACGGTLDGILDVCSSCMKEDKRPWKKAFALFKMKGAGQDLIHQFKYKNCSELARPLGNLAAQIILQQDISFDWIVPVPLHWLRYWQRGYNQAELLCRRLSKVTGKPVKKVLKRVKWTRQQAKLSREQRRENIKKVFSLKRGAIYKKRTILLVDDVLTTGSTLAEASRVLLESGVDEVYILVLARGY